jgi:hypothetical protein
MYPAMTVIVSQWMYRLVSEGASQWEKGFLRTLSVLLAIIALLGAKYFAFNWLDPLMGIIGATMIARWATSLLKDSARILLDHETTSLLSNEIREHIESDGDTRIPVTPSSTTSGTPPTLVATTGLPAAIASRRT